LAIFLSLILNPITVNKESALLKLGAALCLSFVIFFNAAASENSESSSKTIRLAIVNTPVYSGLIAFLLNDFEQQSGLHVDIINGSDVFNLAKENKADIVIAHYGKAALDQFVLSGYGEWPKMVFSNQAVLIGPKTDPAQIKPLQNLSEAFEKIALSKSNFIASPQPGVKYLTNIIWNMANAPDKNNWFIEEKNTVHTIPKIAEEKHAYFIWGAIPFIKYQQQHPTSSLAIVLSKDPLLQRIMCSIVVKKENLLNNNYLGAKQLQAYLLHPETQAKIAAFETPHFEGQLWWPAGRNN
jgi:tungstate transport system substrate-binding protein